MNNIESIQIIGTQRSGSNLLRLILNQFDQVSAPHPPHILKTFKPLITYYGNLEKKQNFLQLAADVADLVNSNPVSWGIKMHAGHIYKECKAYNIYELVSTVYRIKARLDSADIWCCKSMHNAYYCSEMERHGVKPFYIYLYRDGRDVAASFKKAIVGPKHIYYIAKKWKNDQIKAQQVLDMVGKDRFFSIKYEHLLKEPEKVLHVLSDKLNLPYTPEIMRYYNSPESINTASSGQMWANLTKPIIRDHFGMYLNELSENDIRLFNLIAGDVLKDLNYNNIHMEEHLNGTFTEEQLQEFEHENKKMMLKVSQNTSPSDLKRRLKQEEVIKSIKARLGVD